MKPVITARWKKRNQFVWCVWYGEIPRKRVARGWAWSYDSCFAAAERWCQRNLP